MLLSDRYIQDHYVVRTSCRIVYRVNVAQKTDSLQSRRSCDAKWQTMLSGKIKTLFIQTVF